MHIPIVDIGFILIVLFICFAAFYIKKKEVNLEKRGVDIAIFVLSLISLVISLRLFWSMAEYVDVYNANLFLITGGPFWNIMDWLRLGLLLVLCVISGFKLIKRSK